MQSPPAAIRMHRLALAAASALAFASGSCASLGKYVWVDDYTQPALPSDVGYLIAPGDLLSVRVFSHDDMSARARVRSDGKVSLPFLNDVEVAGQPPSLVAKALQTRLKEYVNVPVVTVSLEEQARISVAVLGEVSRIGVFTVDAGANLLQVLAVAGGLGEYAHRDRIFVVRNLPEPIRVRFTFESLAHAEGRAARFRLRDGDSVVVE